LTTSKVSCDGAQYFLDSGKLIPTSPEVFAEYPGEALELESATCLAMGEQDVKMTQFIRNQSRDIFVVVQGKKYALTSFEDYESLSEESLGYNWVTNWFASNIPTGTELPSNASIVTEDGATVGEFIREESESEPIIPSEPSVTTPEEVEPEVVQPKRYTVRPGDFLSKIAASQGSTVAAIVEANNLRNPNFIRVGQVLIIPGNQLVQTEQRDPEPASQPEPEPTPEPEPAPEPETTVGTIEYRVQSGDFLRRIANRFGVSTAAIAEASGLANPNLIFVGQVLTIPNQTVSEPTPEPEPEPEPQPEPEPEQAQTYRVSAGDTLFRIAARFGVSYRDIVSENNISNPNLIRVGQVLRIP